MLTQPELGIRIALTTDYLSEFLPILYKTLLILAFPPTHIDTYLDQLVSRSRTEATAKSLTTKLDLTAATNQPEFKADLEVLLAEGPEYTSDYSLSMLSSTLTISNCGREALAQTRVLFSKTLAKKPKKPTRAFKYITNKPNFDDYYQWEDLSFKALPSKKILNKIKRTNFQLIEQFFTQEKLKLKKLAPLNSLKNLFTDYLNVYLIKDYLRTVISDLASPATFLYLQWNIVCDKIPDLDYALDLIHSLEQALVLFYQFLASCGVITQKDSNLAKFELEQALELIHSECLEEVAADQIMQAFPMDDGDDLLDLTDPDKAAQVLAKLYDLKDSFEQPTPPAHEKTYMKLHKPK